MMQIVRRLLSIDPPPGRSAFLWGPRKVGKSYWLEHHFRSPDDRLIDLLETDTFAEYAARPALLRERWDGRRTIIDESQKAPALLDEVHWLIATRQASFLLTGSSARKLRRADAGGLRSSGPPRPPLSPNLHLPPLPAQFPPRAARGAWRRPQGRPRPLASGSPAGAIGGAPPCDSRPAGPLPSRA